MRCKQLFDLWPADRSVVPSLSNAVSVAVLSLLVCSSVCFRWSVASVLFVSVNRFYVRFASVFFVSILYYNDI